MTKRGLVTRGALSVPGVLRCRERRIDPVRFCLFFTRAIAGEVRCWSQRAMQRKKKSEKEKKKKKERNESLIRATTCNPPPRGDSFNFFFIICLPSQLAKKKPSQSGLDIYAAVLDLARLDTSGLSSAGVGEKHQDLGCGEDQTGSRPVTRRPGSDPLSSRYTVTLRQDLFFHKPALRTRDRYQLLLLERD